MHGEDRQPSDYRNILLLALIVAGAAYLRFHLLADKSFWSDEGFSVCLARLGWGDFFHLLWVREANMALYYFLLRFWLKVGISEVVIRSLSVIFALGTIPVIYAIGARLFRPRAGLIAAFLLSINAFHVRYAQEARAYTLLVFLATLCCWLLLRCVEQPTSRNWSLYMLACVLLVYSHVYGVLVVVAHWLALALLPRPRRIGLLRSMRFFVYGILPIAIFVFRAGNQPIHWLPRPNVAMVRDFYFLLTGNGGYPLLALYVVAWLMAAHARWRSRQAQALETWRYDLLFMWLTFPVAAVLLVSQFQPAFVARYLILCLPAAVLLAAAGIAHLRLAGLRVALLLVLAALSLQGVSRYYRHDFDLDRDDFRAATQYVLAKAQPGDGIFFYAAPGRMTFEYYRLLAGRTIDQPRVVYPSSGENITYRDFLVTPLAEVLQNPSPQPRRTWLFLNEHRVGGRADMGSAVVTAWYARRYSLQSKHSVDGIDVLLFTQR